LANQNDLDSETTNPINTSHVVKFDLHYSPTFFSSGLGLDIPKGLFKTRVVMAKTNTAFDNLKNSALLFPPIVMDWVDPFILTCKNSDEINQYITSNIEMFYKTEEKIDKTTGIATEVSTYDPSTHNDTLPPSTMGMPGLNRFRLPDDQIALENSRVRISIAPNITCSFSNEYILRGLGFTSATYGKRGVGNRFHISNPDSTGWLQVIAEKSPYDMINFLLQSRIFFQLNENHTSFTRTIHSSKFRESRPALFGEDIYAVFKQASIESNALFAIEYQPLTKRFVVGFGDNKDFESTITLTKSLQKILAFDETNVLSKHVTTSNEHVKQVHDVVKYLQLCRILTQDTGDVIVTLANTPSILNRNQSEPIMAALVPKDDILKNVKSVVPRCVFPDHDQDLIFKIYRHAEGGEGRMVQLGWPLDCYVYGMLCGEPIKTASYSK